MNVRFARGQRVLAVEDHLETADMLAWLLAHDGYAVTIASSFHEAADLLGHPFDFVISDIGLLDGSGLELGRRFAQRSPRPRLFAVSGWGMPEDHVATRAAGFERHFVKPVDVSALLTLLKQ